MSDRESRGTGQRGRGASRGAQNVQRGNCENAVSLGARGMHGRQCRGIRADFLRRGVG